MVTTAASLSSEQVRDAVEELTKEATTGDALRFLENLMQDTRSSRARKWLPLKAIKIINFKAISELTIPLSKVTILVGPNGSGKSSALQAIHWAARAASYILPKNTKEMVSFERLDYLPSSDPLNTAHNSELRSEQAFAPTEIVFSHGTETDENVHASIKIRAARNKGGITVSMEGGSAVTPYKQRYQFITTYIPGLAGLSEKESILAQPTLRRQAASGDAGGVLRNILWHVCARRSGETDDSNGKDRLKQLNNLVSKVHPGIKLNVLFDEREDYHISATYCFDSADSKEHPLETAATGILQVVQIFAYLLLFEPKIMLIDEPDAHLHPDKQERLIAALEDAAVEFLTQIVLTTHSPHIAKAASSAAKLVWLKDGVVQTEDSDAIRRQMGWGSLDKSALFFVEDEDDKPIRAILQQWPGLAARISVCRCFGVDNLPHDKLLNGLLVDGELRLKAIVHRDRDFMTASEMQKWRELYKTEGVFTWITDPSDVEGYFCEASYLKALFDLTDGEAELWRAQAASQVGKARDEFLEKRKKIVQILWKNGGSPDAEKMWSDAGGKAPGTVKGKKLWAALKTIAQSKGKDSKMLDGYQIPAGYEMAMDLKGIIESII